MVGDGHGSCAMKCGHCKAGLVAHVGAKAGLFHCNGCGCCFEADRKTVRAGHERCRELPPGIGVQEPPVAKERAERTEEAGVLSAEEPVLSDGVAEPTVTVTEVPVEKSKGTGAVNGRRALTGEMAGD